MGYSRYYLKYWLNVLPVLMCVAPDTLVCVCKPAGHGGVDGVVGCYWLCRIAYWCK